MSDFTQALREDVQNEQLWLSWYRAIYPRLYFHVMRKTNGNGSLTEELIQGALERFVRYDSISKVLSDDHSLVYLRKTAFRLLADHLANSAPEVRVDVDRVVDVSRGEYDDDIQDLRTKLNEDEQALLNWLIEGRTVKEIAQRLDLRYSAASSRIHRLRTTLRALRDE